MKKPKYHIFVCTSSRLTGQLKGFCNSKSSNNILQAFIEAVEEEELTEDVLVTNTGCLGICSKGPIAIVYPENVWYKELTVDDVAEIIESHIKNGRIVERLIIE